MVTPIATPTSSAPLFTQPTANALAQGALQVSALASPSAGLSDTATLSAAGLQALALAQPQPAVSTGANSQTDALAAAAALVSGGPDQTALPPPPGSTALASDQVLISSAGAAALADSLGNADGQGGAGILPLPEGVLIPNLSLAVADQLEQAGLAPGASGPPVSPMPPRIAVA